MVASLGLGGALCSPRNSADKIGSGKWYQRVIAEFTPVKAWLSGRTLLFLEPELAGRLAAAPRRLLAGKVANPQVGGVHE